MFNKKYSFKSRLLSQDKFALSEGQRVKKLILKNRQQRLEGFKPSKRHTRSQEICYTFDVYFFVFNCKKG